MLALQEAVSASLGKLCAVAARHQTSLYDERPIIPSNTKWFPKVKRSGHARLGVLCSFVATRTWTNVSNKVSVIE